MFNKYQNNLLIFCLIAILFSCQTDNGLEPEVKPRFKTPFWEYKGENKLIKQSIDYLTKDPSERERYGKIIRTGGKPMWAESKTILSVCGSPITVVPIVGPIQRRTFKIAVIDFNNKQPFQIFGITEKDEHECFDRSHLYSYFSSFDLEIFEGKGKGFFQKEISPLERALFEKERQNARGVICEVITRWECNRGSMYDAEGQEIIISDTCDPIVETYCYDDNSDNNPGGGHQDPCASGEDQSCQCNPDNCDTDSGTSPNQGSGSDQNGSTGRTYTPKPTDKRSITTLKPVAKQMFRNSCSTAALNFIRHNCSGFRDNENEILNDAKRLNKDWKKHHPMFISQLKQLTNRYYRNTIPFKSFKDAIDKGRVVLTGWDNRPGKPGHAVVVTGYTDKGDIIYYDPNHGKEFLANESVFLTELHIIINC